MKRLMLAITVLLLSTAATAYGQQPAPPADAPRPPGQMQAGHPGGGMPMMDMCRAMMASRMTAGQDMMGGMMGSDMAAGGAMGDPRMMGHMMEMRGEIMKATGDIMIKHARQKQQMGPAPK
jgi:hypothetical protein